jgi:hypothetical protein
VDIINQPNFTCYVKTLRGRERLPVMHVETLPPMDGSQSVGEKVLRSMPRYARPIEVVERERKEFMMRWYEREMAVLTGGSAPVTNEPIDSGDLFPTDSPLQDDEMLEAANTRKRRVRTKRTSQSGSNAATDS